jgi:outer membrane protein assembly factor BamA
MKILGRFSFILPLLVSSLFAQKIIYKAASVSFTHSGPYSQAQLEAAAGIHAGTTFNSDDLGAAAQRLIDTGYFDNAGATLSGQVTFAAVLFDVQPTDRSHMLHAGFENFVWLTPAEIEAALHAKSALFAGYLPENSPLADTFDAALTAALAAKGITAHVSHDTVEPTMLRPTRSLEFRIDTPTIRVANVKLAGVPADLVPLIQKSVNSAAQAPYSEGLAGLTTSDRILAPLLDAGYIQASLSGISLAPTTSGDSSSVIVSAILAPGDIYHVSTISFAGTPLLSADAFAASATLHPGDIAARAELLKTLKPLDDAYRRQGYMDVTIDASPRLDSSAHTVAYTVTLTPGEQYRVHDVTTNNLDPAAKADFDSHFQLKQGELFNPEYVSGFLKGNSALTSLAPYIGTWKAYADPNTHTVDLVVTFMNRNGSITVPVTVHP